MSYLLASIVARGKGDGMAKKKQLTVTELARLGGKGRAKKLSPARRKEIAQKAIAARWGEKGEKR
jgi:hypothetical protein